MLSDVLQPLTFYLLGFSKDGIVLIQNYIDRTGDVQNPVLLLAHNGQADILENPGTETWIQR